MFRGIEQMKLNTWQNDNRLLSRMSPKIIIAELPCGTWGHLQSLSQHPLCATSILHGKGDMPP